MHDPIHAFVGLEPVVSISDLVRDMNVLFRHSFGVWLYLRLFYNHPFRVFRKMQLLVNIIPRDLVSLIVLLLLIIYILLKIRPNDKKYEFSISNTSKYFLAPFLFFKKFIFIPCLPVSPHLIKSF
jgi:hypothetical protein